MNNTDVRSIRPARFAKFVDLTAEQKLLLDSLKSECGMTYSAVFRRGIELVAKEFEPVLKSRGFVLEV